ncbi:putative Zinc transporter 2 [Cocos nucifera]|uniref:Putative Zinc transporter 2 n=1 Tax=Cocos nucifera TaxID=13894 RepID=A0A8K0I7C5_COCNU|nr:putative Zinc transporter 2 [Cocos nucifera]
MKKTSRPLWKTWLLLLFLVLSTSLVNAHGGHDHDANGDHEQDNLRSRGLIAVKIWCLVILLVSTFAGGVSPYFYGWNESFLLMGTQFAGGVFLGMPTAPSPISRPKLTLSHLC